MPFAGGVGVMEILLLVLLGVLLFGAKKVPDLARSAGKGMKEFKDSVTEFKKPIDEVTELVPMEQVKTVASLRNPRTALTKILTDEPKKPEATQTDS